MQCLTKGRDVVNLHFVHQEKNKVSLRSLSMVLRQLPPEGGDQEHGKRVLESVDMARQAVQLDVKDGTSWCKYNSTVTLLESQNPSVN